MGIQWGAEPGRGRTMRIFRLKPGQETLEGIWLLGNLTSVLLHYTEHGSLPCLGDECSHCPAETMCRWYGPAAVPWGKPNPNGGAKKLQSVILELNAICARELVGLNLRGMHVYLWRGKASNAPLLLRPMDGPPKEAVLPPDFDVRPQLERIWGFTPVYESAEEIP